MRKSGSRVLVGVACASAMTVIALSVVLVAGAHGAKHPAHSAGSERPVVAERPELPLSESFLGLWFPPTGHASRTAIEQFSLSDGAPLHTLIWLTGHLEGESFEPGPEGMLWLTLTTGPRASCPRCLDSFSEPYSCTNQVLRFDPVTGRLTRVRKFPNSMLIEEARPSPNGRWLLAHVRGCTSSWRNAHLLAINLRTGAKWTVGLQATACHDLGAAEWNESGSELVVPYGPSRLPAGTTYVPKRFGEELCPSPQPSGLALVKAGSSSKFSPSALIEPAAGCSFRSAIFDSEGILAFEDCSEVGPHEEVVGEPGQGYLVQLNDSHEVVHRLPLEIDGCPCGVASDPLNGRILVKHGHWLWEYHDGSLRLIKHYTPPEQGFDWEPILTWGGS